MSFSKWQHQLFRRQKNHIIFQQKQINPLTLLNNHIGVKLMILRSTQKNTLRIQNYHLALPLNNNEIGSLQSLIIPCRV